MWMGDSVDEWCGWIEWCDRMVVWWCDGMVWWYGMLWCGVMAMACYGGMLCYAMLCYGMVWYGLVWCGVMTCCGVMAWYGVV